MIRCWLFGHKPDPDEREPVSDDRAEAPNEGETVMNPFPTEMLFRDELRALINRQSMENGSDTPDIILANYLSDCLKAFDSATRWRDQWRS